MVFNTALSGIQAASNALDVTGNNIANSSTVGFKGSRAEFADVYSYNTYSVGQTAIGGGVRLSRVGQSFATGNIYGTNNTLDLAINGSGFFIMSDNGTKSYTRAGQFGIDNQNFIVNAQNQQLNGLLADSTGKITSVSGPLQINTATMPPNPSSTVTAGLNLFSNSTSPSVDWSGGATPVGATFNNTISSTIYDSLGNSHVLSMYFIKADANAAAGSPDASSPPGTADQWYVAFQIDNQDVPAAITPGTQNTNNLFRANFNPDGSFAGVLDTSDNPLANNLIPLSINLNNGANPLNINVDLTSSTQFGSPFAVQSAITDGFGAGSLSGLDIDLDGVLLGRYNNGQTRALGQIQLANFADPQGLQNIGNTSWAQTTASGQALIGAPGAGSLGTVNSGSLESSNVDLTSELVDLISEQRNFQANAQTIRTGDAVTQTIINIR